ncbi:MAG TPA: prolipoprotein diacylglyceryl transferase [Ferruginibacter sp.]|nr:prolipoprotein diacylglyceryl transferase [Ferruginibacter sp.]
MQFPVTISIGASVIPLHGIIEFAAYFIGFRYFLYLRKKQPDAISTTNRIWILIGAILGSVLGSRIAGGLEDPDRLKMANNVLMHFYLNKTVLGGFLGGVWGVEIIKKMIGEKSSSGDLFTYPLILALIIGRIGCFSMGVYEETYGTATSFFTGMNLGDGKMRHPVTLYEMVFLLLIWIGLQQTEKKYELASGLRFKIFMIAYCLFRFVLDFIKPHYTYSTGLSAIQATALIGLLYYVILWFQNKKLYLVK